MPRIDHHDEDETTPRSLRKRVVFLTLLFLAATLIYAEMFIRFSN